MMEGVTLDPPWGGEWPSDGLAVDVPTPAPGEHWRILRARIAAMGMEPEPNLHPDHGLVGYSLRLRNASVGLGVVQRAHGLALAMTAVLCRGMEREQLALAAIDRANRHLRLGQILYYPGPPPELAFYLSLPWDMVSDALFPAIVRAARREIEQAGFPAVALVRGYHPADLEQLWRHLEQLAQAELAAREAESAEPRPPACSESADRPRRRRVARAATKPKQQAPLADSAGVKKPRQRKKPPGRQGP